MEFKVGDIIEAFGLRGVVTEVSGHPSYPICVDFDESAGGERFTADGKERVWHRAPSLKLIERPKKTKKVKVWVNAYPETYSLRNVVCIHDNEAMARSTCAKDGITQQIEVEVLDETT